MKFKNNKDMKLNKLKRSIKNTSFKKRRKQIQEIEQNNVDLRQEGNNQQIDEHQQRVQQIQQGINQEQADYNEQIQKVEQQLIAGQNQQIDLLENNQRNLQQYQQQISNTGVIYMSRVPPYMTPNFIRKLLSNYGVQRIYLLPESEWTRKNRIKKGGSKRICFREGWIQFSDKKVAKSVALTLNGQKMVQKKGTFYSQDVWNLKYLAKFKWHHLTQKLAHQQRMKKEHLRLQMQQQRKLHQYYSNQAHKSSKIKGIIKTKLSKGKELKGSSNRQFEQRKALDQQKD